MMNVYVIELLPPDLTVEQCKYQIRQYEIERETEMYVWVKKVDPRIVPERNQAVKRMKTDIFRFGRFNKKLLAVKK